MHGYSSRRSFLASSLLIVSSRSNIWAIAIRLKLCSGEYSWPFLGRLQWQEIGNRPFQLNVMFLGQVVVRIKVSW